MMRFIAVFLLSILATTTHAAKIDVKNSELNWKATKLTGKHWGTVKIKEGNIKEKDGSLTGGNFVVDMESIDIDKEDLQGEWKAKLLTHLNSADFFSVDKFKTSELKIKSVKSLKNNKFLVSAEMTIKGKTQAVKDFEVAKKDGAYKGTIVFNRTKFGIKYNSGSFFENLGDKLIHDDVSLTFSVK